MTYSYDLGTHSRLVSSRTPEAQAWFDRGLVWCNGCSHEESVACIERAIAADPESAIAHWGAARARECNYVKPWEACDDEDL